MGKAKYFAKSYSQEITRHFEDYNDQNKSELENLSETNDETYFSKYMDNYFESLELAIDEWSTNNDLELGGMSPVQYIQDIDDVKEVIKVFSECVCISDIDNIPYFLVEKIQSFGEVAFDTIMELILKLTLDSDEQIILMSQSIKLLGELKAEKSINLLISILNKYDNDLVKEAASIALEEMGESAVDAIIAAVKDVENLGESEEYLLQSLTNIGIEQDLDKIFLFLKDVFRKAKNKILIVSLLGDYGDGRAIPLLRSYVEKNLDTIDKNTYLEITSVIIKLGGEVKDLKKNF